MPRNWESYQSQAESSPWGALKIVILGLFVLTCLGVGCSVVGYSLGWFGDAAAVVKQEIAPSALLKKYEWFKDASAALDAKAASLKVYESRFADLKSEYKGVPRAGWSRDDREQYNLWVSECAGVAASYNLLAADYNAQMAKINWAFTNVGQVPAGGQPLPREYRPYMESK